MSIKIHKDTIITYTCPECDHQWEVFNPKSVYGTKFCPECGVSNVVEQEIPSVLNNGYDTMLKAMSPFFQFNK
jgi:transcription elongation factor Elf1